MDHKPGALRVANDELSTVREAMRELNRLVDALERGEL
jgi:exonuclease VII small subunit